ncbi:MAG: SpoIIE family protein phosphatase [Planctomycetota bacterium]
MSLRRKVMLVLLMAAVLPMLAVRAVQAVSIYRLQTQVAEQMREQLNDQAQEDMQRTVKGYASSLDQVGNLGLSLLKLQASHVEFRLKGPQPRNAVRLPSVQELALYQADGAGPYKIEPSLRHAVVTEDGGLEPLMITYDTQVYLSFDEVVSNESRLELDKLASMTPVYREIHDKVDETILWQYTSLESGMHFSYPAKSAFPEGYDPKDQDWYERAINARGAVTSQPYVDAATGQLVITFAMPVANRSRELAGVTAIDLRVSELLDPLALNTEWAEDASVIVVASHPAKDRQGLRSVREKLRDRPSKPNRNNQPGRPVRPLSDRSRGDNADQVADTSFPADVYVVADIMQEQGKRRSQRTLETVAFDSADDRAVVSDDLVNGKSGVQRVMIDGQDRMIAYGQIGTGDEGRRVFAMIIAPTRTIQRPAEQQVRQVNEDLTASLVNTGGILILLLLIVFASAFLTSFRLTRPISELADASMRVARGDLDTKVQVRRKDELGQLGDAFNAMVPALRDRMKIRESLAVAMQVQQSLLPQAPPQMKGLDLAGHSEYCDETGGDYYDFIQLDQLGPNAIAVAVGDVTGHGIAAALLMATGRALIRSHANTTGSLGEVFTAVNKQLCDSEFTGRFMTVMYLIIENPGETEGPIRVRYMSAGHDPVLVYRPADDGFFELEGHDIPLGIDSDWQYNEQTSDALRPGDVLVAGTDGIWECFNPHNQQFGKERMKQTIREAAQGSADDIAKAVSNACRRWRGTREQNDDITLVVVKLDDPATA